MLIITEILLYFDTGLLKRLSTDASEKGIVVIISHVMLYCNELPISYAF